ncbi:hypothetical protein [Burkholderia multivorans]|uniref:hypothetical protein n=1 Tax=Burkholderia multivorans TaxID=87883 RepID=UPI0020B2242F|nr:hypothetical protein [Burkholderia multivorans]
MLDGPGAGRDVRRHAAARGPELSIRYAGSTDDSEVVFDRPIKCCDGLHSISHCSPMRAADRVKRGDTSGYALDAGVTDDRNRHRAGGNAHAPVNERREIEGEEENAARESRVSHWEPLK